MKESYIEGQLKLKIEKSGGVCLKFWPISETGFPDRIILLPKGRIYFVETKAPNGIVKKKQSWRHVKLRSLGFDESVLWNILEVNNFVNEVGTI